MTVDNQSRQYNLSRKEASVLLKVSIRTVDRYLKSKKLSTLEYDGRIWLSREEVEGFSMLGKVDKGVDNVDTLSTPLSTPVYVDNIDKTVDIDVDNKVDTVYSVSTSKPSRQDSTYKKLFNEMQIELREKQERLELANYRVGQLECQVRNSISLIEHHQESRQKKQKEDELGTQLKSSVNIIKNLSTKLKALKFSKRILFVFIMLILALQPLWVYFLYKN